MLVTNDVADTREVGFGDQTRATTHVALGQYCHAQQVGYGHHRHVQQEESKRSLSIRDAYNGLPGTTDDVRAGECIMFYRPSGHAVHDANFAIVSTFVVSVFLRMSLHRHRPSQ